MDILVGPEMACFVELIPCTTMEGKSFVSCLGHQDHCFSHCHVTQIYYYGTHMDIDCFSVD